MKCNKCGYCCQTLILEASYEDGKREPRIFTEGMMLNLDDPLEERLWSLNGTQEFPCIYLDLKTNRCTIYKTRPQMCRDFEAGNDARCGQCDGKERLKVEA
jgi:Fe-S-cluster containining protein